MFKNTEFVTTHNILFVFLLTVAAFFRFVFLGYSDLQGDETKVFEYRNTEDILKFLLNNSKGPGQYMVAKLTEMLGISSMDPEFLYRMPFAIAGFISVYLFYFIAKKFYNERIGINVLLVASLNGFFIAFSRIIQYQAFMILLALISSLFFLNFLKEGNKKYLFLSSLTGVVAALFHYDAVSFIIPQLTLLFLIEDKVKNYGIYFFGLATSLIFYVPYVLSESFQSTFKYLVNDRAVANFSYDSVLYSLKLSSVYMSKEYLVIIFAALVLALWNLKLQSFYYRGVLFVLLLVICGRYYVGHPYKPLILFSTLLSFFSFIPIFLSSGITLTKKYFYIWFLISFTIYFLILNKPLTHIYAVFVPLTFLAGYQLSKIKNKVLRYGIILTLFISAISFSYQAYIENKTEYPWEFEKYMFGSMYKGISEGEVVRGIFGFPYYRNLANLNRDFNSVVDENVTPAIYSNIKAPRLRYYLPRKYPLGLPSMSYYIEVRDSWDYEPENSAIINSPKIRVFEAENYSIYKVL